MRKPKANRLEGFALVEVLVAVVIITVGLVFVFRSFSTSVNALRVSRHYHEASALLDNALCDLESGNLTIDSIIDSTVVIGGEKFSFIVEQPRHPTYSGLGMQEVLMKISWDEGGREIGFSALVKK